MPSVIKLSFINTSLCSLYTSKKLFALAALSVSLQEVFLLNPYESFYFILLKEGRVRGIAGATKPVDPENELNVNRLGDTVWKVVV